MHGKNNLLSIPGMGLVLLVILFSKPYAGALEPGQYSVGFKTLEMFDNSRTVLSKYDYFGAPIEGNRERPIQICVWYPAKEKDDAQKMVLGEYNFPYPDNAEFIDYLSEIQNREIGFA